METLAVQYLTHEDPDNGRALFAYFPDETPTASGQRRCDSLTEQHTACAPAYAAAARSARPAEYKALHRELAQLVAREGVSLKIL